MAKRICLLMVVGLLAACRSTGKPVTETLNVAYPDVETVNINLRMSVGDLMIDPSQATGITGGLTTNVVSWQADVSTSVDAITIAQGQDRSNSINNAVNEWDINLGTEKAFNFDIRSGGADVRLNLTDLDVGTLNLDGGAGEVALVYGASGESTTNSADINLTTGAFSAVGLLNSGLRELSVTGRSSDFRLEFNGDGLEEDTRVDLETTTGEVVIIVPEGLPVEVSFRTTNGVAQEVSPAFTTMSSDLFLSGGFAEAEGARLFITIRTTSGDIRLNTISGT